MEYCKFNQIYEDVLQTICPFLKCEKIKKGQYLFKYGEPSKAFYTLLKGRISIRIPRNPHLKNQSESLIGGSDLANTLKNEVVVCSSKSVAPRAKVLKVIEANEFKQEKRKESSNKAFIKIEEEEEENNEKDLKRIRHKYATKKLCNL